LAVLGGGKPRRPDRPTLESRKAAAANQAPPPPSEDNTPPSDAAGGGCSGSSGDGGNGDGGRKRKEPEDEEEEEEEDIEGFAFSLGLVIAATAGSFVEGLVTPSANPYAIVESLPAGIRHVALNEAYHVGLGMIEKDNEDEDEEMPSPPSSPPANQ